MTVVSLEAIVAALNKFGVRYIVVGGLAVAAHGHGRLTIDLDLVLELTTANISAAITALQSLAYEPVVPVKITDFSDAETRQSWLEQKNMTVFSLRSEQHPYTPIDLFIYEPFDFGSEFERALVDEISPGNVVRFVSLDTLITMKEATGRPKDQDDVRQLKSIRDNQV